MVIKMKKFIDKDYLLNLMETKNFAKKLDELELITDDIFDKILQVICELQIKLDILNNRNNKESDSISYFHCGICKQDSPHNMKCPCCE
jgi:hypothetical protein